MKKSESRREKFSIVLDGSFDQWREQARQALVHGYPPDSIEWMAPSEKQMLLEIPETPVFSKAGPKMRAPIVPRPFVELAERVAAHRNPLPWDLLYRVLWRLVHGESHLLENPADPDVHTLHKMETAIRKDVHKMKAFVRFKRVGDQYVAWYDPDHFILPQVIPFFKKRFRTQEWALLTPEQSVIWDKKEIQFAPGVSQSQAPSEDALDELWRSYYKSIFNPARIKLRAMKKELPVRRWKALPESTVISGLLREGARREQKMIEKQNRSAADFLPPEGERDLVNLKTAAAGCRGCDLYKNASQTVFGEGPASAEMVLIGEQPGDFEDRQGRPFVGPAGKILDRALEEAGVDRQEVYLTNAVKHFKFKMTQGRRLHQKPISREIVACHPWLNEEMKDLKPKVVVLLGASAAQSVMGKVIKLGDFRGKVIETNICDKTIVTYHPSAILRIPDKEAQAQAMKQLVTDLRKGTELLLAKRQK